MGNNLLFLDHRGAGNIFTVAVHILWIMLMACMCEMEVAPTVIQVVMVILKKALEINIYELKKKNRMMSAYIAGEHL